MDKRIFNIVLGIIIILVGVFLLLITTNFIDINLDASWVFGILFFVAFLIFMGFYVSMHRKQFWPLIPGIIMLGLSLLILTENFGINGNIGAGLFILFIGFSFLAVYVLHSEHWWAIIPAGILASVSLVIFFGDTLGVGLMFLGMGATFLALYFVLRGTDEQHWWPIIPGGILAFMGLMFLFFESIDFGNLLLPIALIIIGFFLILNSLKKQRSAKSETSEKKM